MAKLQADNEENYDNSSLSIHEYNELHPHDEEPSDPISLMRLVHEKRRGRRSAYIPKKKKQLEDV